MADNLTFRGKSVGGMKDFEIQQLFQFMMFIATLVFDNTKYLPLKRYILLHISIS